MGGYGFEGEADNAERIEQTKKRIAEIEAEIEKIDDILYKSIYEGMISCV